MSSLPRVPCPHCGEMNLATDTVCLACGKALRPAAAPARPRGLTGLGLPAVSGIWSVVLLAVCFGVSAILIPVAAHLPRWVEVELVLAAWWVVWVLALGVLLYRGYTVHDDAPAPQWRRGKGREGGGLSDLPVDDGCFSFGELGCAVGEEGCGGVLFGLAILVGLVVGIWLTFEFLLPAIAFLLYLLIHRMLSVVVNAPHTCRGSLSRAFGWAALWAGVYTAPIALIVWIVHMAVRHY